jgi:hypothetical protein
MEYYSEQMNKDLREAAATAHQSDAKTANEVTSHQH